jgi:Ser/Thr protein kinase RdoA (MazF antagonist)
VDGRAVATEDDEFMAAASLKLVHSALADVDADLPSFITKVESCETILMNPAQAPKLVGSDRLFLEKLYEMLRKDLSGIGGAWQPLHGDTHLGNVIITGSGAIWMDLEAACLGPLEWDIVNLPISTWSKFSAVDVGLMRLFADVRSLCVAVWCWAEFDRSAATAEAAIHHLGVLKDRLS